MAMKSTDKTAVQKISPGTYRVVEVGGSSAITGRYVYAIKAARNARITSSDATDIPAASTTRRTSGAGRNKVIGR